MSWIRCQEDSYLRELETRVLECRSDGDGFLAVLEETILYPEGGGQPPDLGRVANANVLDVQKDEQEDAQQGDGGRVLHRLDAPVSGEVTIQVDWSRRWDHMQQHTAQHLITALALDGWGIRTVGFHLGSEACWIDTDASEISADVLGDLEDAVNREIRAARPVRWHEIPAEEIATARIGGLEVRSRRLPEGHAGPLRLVEIEGIDLNTCGGTHVASTAELQAVHLRRTERAKGGTRIPYLAGDRLRLELAVSLARTEDLKERLTAGESDLLASVERLQEEAAAGRREARQLGKDLAQLLGRDLAARGESPLHFERGDSDLGLLAAVARSALEAGPELVLLLTAPSAGTREGFFLLAGPPERVREKGPQVAAALGAPSGGGPPGIYQGRAAELHRAEEALAVLRSG